MKCKICTSEIGMNCLESSFPEAEARASIILLRGCVTVLEIVFVGQCEVFVCLDF